MNSALGMYVRLTQRTDPNDPIVAEEIRKGIRHTYGITDVHDHLPRFRAAAKGNILEIGVRYGASTSAFLLGIEEQGGHVYSIDIENCCVFFGHPQWTFIQADSVKEVERLKNLIPRELDLLFVDGDHSYEGCFSDLKNFGPRAKTVMIHDASARENPAVLRAVEEYFFSSKCRQKQMICHTDSHGLAILS